MTVTFIFHCVQLLLCSKAVIVYQTVPPRGLRHQICRNIAAFKVFGKIYLHINIPRVSRDPIDLKKKNYNKKINFFLSENRNYFNLIIVFLILFIMHIEE